MQESYPKVRSGACNFFTLARHAFAATNTAREMKKQITSIAASILPLGLLFLISGCSTMSVTPLATSNADTYTQHEQKNGLVVGIHPMTDKREIKDMFKINLLDKGLLPILVVAENHSASASFVIAKEKVFVLNANTGSASTPQTKAVTSGTAGTAVAVTGVVLGGLGGGALMIVGAEMASKATVIQYNLADKEFFGKTLGSGDKAQGFVYFQFPEGSLSSGNYHVVAEGRNPATGEATMFDFPVNLTLPK